MRRISPGGGFTLLEIIISIGILAFVCVFVLRMFASSMNTEDKARDMDNAVSKASSAIECFKTFGTLDPNVVGDTLGGQYIFRPGSDGGSEAETYYDEKWEKCNVQNPKGYTIYLKINPADAQRIQTIDVRVIKHAPYRLQNEQNTELFSVQGARFTGQAVAANA